MQKEARFSLRREKLLPPIDSTVEENDIDNFLNDYDSRTSQSSEKKLVDFELARA